MFVGHEPTHVSLDALEGLRLFVAKILLQHLFYVTQTVHIAGTDGKGSVAKMMSLMLEESGYKTGLFVSPHLVDINERISINGVNISDEDFKKLIKSMDKSYFSEHRDYAMIMLMIDSGMRLGECSCLLMEDINLARHQIALRAEITKGRKDRMVYFSAKTEQVIRRWIQYKDRYVETDYLFPVQNGTGMHIQVGNFETNFKKYLKRVGLDENITPHCLRNNFAKRCLMNGMDIFTLSRILGHSSVTVTEQAYLDLTDEDIGKRYQHYSPVSAMR